MTKNNNPIIKKFNEQFSTDDVQFKCDDSRWLDPTPEMLNDPMFNAIWNCIKTWDINVPEVYDGYCGATGNHARAILEAIRRLKEEQRINSLGDFANSVAEIEQIFNKKKENNKNVR